MQFYIATLYQYVMVKKYFSPLESFCFYFFNLSKAHLYHPKYFSLLLIPRKTSLLLLLLQSTLKLENLTGRWKIGFKPWTLLHLNYYFSILPKMTFYLSNYYDLPFPSLHSSSSLPSLHQKLCLYIADLLIQ